MPASQAEFGSAETCVRSRMPVVLVDMWREREARQHLRLRACMIVLSHLFKFLKQSSCGTQKPDNNTGCCSSEGGT
jgi:hypothetical protein